MWIPGRNAACPPPAVAAAAAVRILRRRRRSGCRKLNLAPHEGLRETGRGVLHVLVWRRHGLPAPRPMHTRSKIHSYALATGAQMTAL